jgi:peptidoglycan hydrolase-like protein with peptidoglycan-binding domain
MLNKLLISARALALGVALSAVSLPALADSSSDAKLEAMQQKLDQSIKMIEALSARVKELETRPANSSVAAAGPSTVAPGSASAAEEQRLQTVEQKVAQIETSDATRQTDDTGLPMHGFADVNIGNRNPYFGYFKGANVGSLDFYIAPRLGDRVVSLAELIFETGPDGHVGTDLERFQLGYQFNDQATVWVGRFHTPYGYVNTALHHGVWLADALRRPKFVNFEDKGGVMPSHTVGVWVTGAQRLSEGKFLYDVYVGNAQKIEDGTLDMQNGGTDHGAAIAGTRLSYQFSGGGIEGLTVGINGFTDKVASNNLTLNNITRVNMMGAYAVYDTDEWEHIIEAYSFRDKNLNGSPGTHRSNAWFAQLAYRARWGLPYIRYERASLDQTDPFFSEQTFGASYYRSALGVRFDLNDKSSVKFEVAHTRTTDFRVDDTLGLPEQYNEVLAQYAVRF